MLSFEKGPEPAELLAWKAQKNREEGRALVDVSFSELSTDAKRAMQEALLREQGYLCAYCAARIEQDSMRIEHWHPHSTHPQLRFKWSNLLGVCVGLTNGEEHCDRIRGDRVLVTRPRRWPVACRSSTRRARRKQVSGLMRLATLQPRRTAQFST